MRSVETAATSRAVLGSLASVSTRHGMADLSARLQDVRDWLASDLAELEAALASHARGGDLAERAAAHLLAQPGKRVRPLCVVLAARAGGRAMDGAVRDLGTVAELVHAATLLHDDVIDDGAERRGAPAARVVYGNPASVLGGDHLLIAALSMAWRTGLSGVFGELLDTIDAMVAAEAEQLERRGRFEPDRASYLRVAAGKTAALFIWALSAGGQAAGLSYGAIRALRTAGRALGLAFQLVDDALDVAGDPAVTGKDALRDLREGKLTWPLILAAERSERLATELEVASAGDHDTNMGRLRAAIADTGAVADTRRWARELAAEARDALLTLPDGPARGALIAVVDASVARAR